VRTLGMARRHGADPAYVDHRADLLSTVDMLRAEVSDLRREAAPEVAAKGHFVDVERALSQIHTRLQAPG
jgi:hypothetical protein